MDGDGKCTGRLHGPPFRMPPGTKDAGSEGWLRISMLSPGDILSVKTEDNSYVFVLTGDGFAAMLAGAGEAREVKLLGCADGGGGNISWGSIQRGGRLLFSDHGEDGQATITSPIQAILTKASRTPSVAHPISSRSPAKHAALEAPRPTARPVAIPRIAIPSPRA